MTKIGDNAFTHAGLTSIVLPASLRIIGNEAFSGNDCLQEITLPKGLSRIGTGAFRNCQISTVTIPSSVTVIDANPFPECRSLYEVLVEDGNSLYCAVDGCLYSADLSRFLCCPGSKAGSLTIMSGVTSITNDAFCGCSGLESLMLPDGIVSIGLRVFYGCEGLKNLSLPKSINSIDALTFYGCSLESLAFTGNLPEMTSTTFFGLDPNTILYYPADNPTYTAEKMQNYGGTLTWVAVEAQPDPDCVLPDELKSLEDDALAGTHFRYVKLPDGMTTLGNRIFDGCDRLEAVYVPASVTSIAPEAFTGAPDGLTIIGKAGSDIAAFAAEKGITFREG